MEMMGEPLAELLGEELHARVKDRIEIKIDMWRAFRYEQSIDWGSSKLKSI